MAQQWHQLDHMQIICTSLRTDNHASTSPLSFYMLDALPAAQPTASKHWRQLRHTYGGSIVTVTGRGQSGRLWLSASLWIVTNCSCRSIISHPTYFQPMIMPGISDILVIEIILVIVIVNYPTLPGITSIMTWNLTAMDSTATVQPTVR